MELTIEKENEDNFVKKFCRFKTCEKHTMSSLIIITFPTSLQVPTALHLYLAGYLKKKKSKIFFFFFQYETGRILKKFHFWGSYKFSLDLRLHLILVLYSSLYVFHKFWIYKRILQNFLRFRFLLSILLDKSKTKCYWLNSVCFFKML